MFLVQLTPPTKHGKICQVLKDKGLILKGLSLFSCLNITKYNYLQCTYTVYTTMYIARFIESVGVQALKRTDIKRRPLAATDLQPLSLNQKNIGS